VALDEALRQMPAGVVVVEAPLGNVIYANARAREVAEDELGRQLTAEMDLDWEIFHPDGRRYLVEEWPLVRSITSGEQVVDEEYFQVLPDGGRRVVRCRSSPVYDDQRRIVAGVVITQDITRLKVQEDGLRHLAGLLDNTEDAIVALDAQWHITAWNGGAERMYGWTAEEVIGRHTLEVAHLEMTDAERAEVRRRVAEDGRWRGDVVAHRKDGSVVTVELITVAIHDEFDAVTGFLGIHRDVSDRYRGQEESEDSKAILESMTDAFVAVDADWRFTYANDRALRRMENWEGAPVALADIVGRSMWEVLPRTVGTEFERQFRKAMRDRRPVEFETYSEPADMWIEARVHPTASGISIYYREVTERHRAAEERDRSARRSAAVAELGVRALATNDVQAVMDDAAVRVAQMLRADIVGLVEILPGGEDLLLRAGHGWTRSEVGKVSAPAGRGSLVGYTLMEREPVVSDDLATDDRFTISKFLAAEQPASGVSVVIGGRDEPFGAIGAFSHERRTFSQDDVNFLQSVANVLATAVERSEAEQAVIDVKEAERRRIARDIHDEALQALTDAIARSADDPGDWLVPTLKRAASHLRAAVFDLRLGAEASRPFPEVLQGLVDAQRAMAPGLTISLELQKGTPSGSLGRRGTEILRTVGEAITNARRHADAGEIRVVAWGSARRLGVEVADDGRGFDVGSVPAGTTGIKGMRERVDLLDGDLDITSSPGWGTRVRLTVPQARDREVSDREVRLLLVEDHASVRQSITAMFEREPGFTVVGQAGSLAEARGMLEDVDVAVVDLGLPDGDGSDLIPELREASPRAQALVLSASLDRSRTARAIEQGAAASLDKVIALDELVDAVRRLRAGETLIPRDELDELLRVAEGERREESRARHAIEQLTPREREVLQALADGLDTQEIARRLHITLRTTRNHISSILAKLGVHSQLQAVLFGLRHGVVEIR
jgi:PAS domain S-box-containing protein